MALELRFRAVGLVGRSSTTSTKPWCRNVALPTFLPKCATRCHLSGHIINRVYLSNTSGVYRDGKRLSTVSRAGPEETRETIVELDEPDIVENDVDSFNIFDLKSYSAKLEAPWGPKNSVLGMAGWGASFVLVGLAFIPIARFAAGPGGFVDLSQQDKSIFALINQIVETMVGIGVITTSAGTFYNKTPSVLRLNTEGPFRKPDGWLVWALIGVLLAPEVVFVASSLVEALGVEDLQARGTADAISQILSLDQVTFACLFTTTAILAPLLEETVFRGFLLPSLAKYMPTPLAVVLSSIAFGLVHFSPRDTPQLTALGLLLGFSYVRSGNLLTPMIIHGTWNGTVLTILYILQANGIDIQQLLHSGQI
jgi:membrane protease YdiL (CAAX protease family)